MLNWAIRYSSAVALLDDIAPGSVLDVGSGEHGLNLYRSYDLVIRTDIQLPAPPHRPGPFIVADALRLPLRAGSVDAVLSLDLIEHLAAPDRPRAIAEMCRVARGHVVVGFPLGAVARRTDAAYAGLLRATHRELPDWLTEHRAVDYPERTSVLRDVPSGWKVTATAANANALVQSLAVVADSTRRTAPMAERLASRFLREGFPRGIHMRPAYRRLFVLERQSQGADW